MPRFLSPKELAKAIGVSESSLKRWADEGLLQVSRTAGGHRRIALRDAVRYLRKTGLPIVDPHALGLADLSAVPADAAADLNAALVDALKDGRAEIVRGIVVAQYLAGRSVAALCDGPLAAALHDIGELWRHGPEGIFIEHRAVEICIQSLSQLRSLIPAPEPDAPRAIGGALESDPYAIPTLMAACVLGAAGWETVNLGPNLPLPALLIAVRHHRPALVWLSCSADDAAAKHDRDLRKTGLALAKQGIKVVVGGRAWKSAHFPSDGGLTLAGSMAEVAAFAEGLRTAGV